MGQAVHTCGLGSANSGGCGHRHAQGSLLSSPDYSKEPKCITEDSWVRAGLQKALHSVLSVQTCAYPKECLSESVSISHLVGGWTLIAGPAIPSGSVPWPLGDSHQTRSHSSLRELHSLLGICLMILHSLWQQSPGWGKHPKKVPSAQNT